jgi:hypothetical protein
VRPPHRALTGIAKLPVASDAIATSCIGEGVVRHYFRHRTEPEILFLKIYLRSKPGDDGVSSNPAYIGIVLNHRLDQEWSIVQQHV